MLVSPSPHSNLALKFYLYFLLGRYVEIMDILRHKKAQLPIPPITSTKKKVTSMTTVGVGADDSDMDCGDALGLGLGAEAGSSTGPGTLRRGHD